MQRRLRVGSLCTGVGGIEIALGKFFDNINLVFMADNNTASRKVLTRRFPDIPNLGDIRNIDYTGWEIDLLTAGFPCQPVSQSGKRQGVGSDERWLWDEIVRALRELQPAYVFLENVPGLFTAPAPSSIEPCPWCVGNGSGEHDMRAFNVVLGDLASHGYDAKWESIRAAVVGAPHRRERLFIFATHSERARRKRWTVREMDTGVSSQSCEQVEFAETRWENEGTS